MYIYTYAFNNVMLYILVFAFIIKSKSVYRRVYMIINHKMKMSKSWLRRSRIYKWNPNLKKKNIK